MQLTAEAAYLIKNLILKEQVDELNELLEN